MIFLQKISLFLKIELMTAIFDLYRNLITDVAEVYRKQRIAYGNHTLTKLFLEKKYIFIRFKIVG